MPVLVFFFMEKGLVFGIHKYRTVRLFLERLYIDTGQWPKYDFKQNYSLEY